MSDLATDEKVCPFCAETIKRAAIRCRYCHSDLPEADEAGFETVAAQPPQPAESAPAGEAGFETVAAQPPQPAESTPVVEEGPPGPVSKPRRTFIGSLRLLIGLLVLCLVLIGVTAYAFYRSQNPDQGSGPITSTQAREAGLQQATKLTEKVLSYDWQSLDKDIVANEALLAPSFRAQYAKTMAGVHQKTLANHVKLTASAVATSVVSASPHKVVALVFVNQTTTAKGSSNQRIDQNRVRVTLTRDDGPWRVSKMDAF